MMKRLCALIAALTAALLLPACGAAGTPEPEASPEPVTVSFANGEFDSGTEEIKLVLETGETALLDEFAGLKTADLSGSLCFEEISAWASVHPETEVIYTVLLPDGSEYPSDTAKIGLPDFSGGDTAALINALQCLPELEKLELGLFTEEGESFDWPALKTLQDALPDVLIDGSFLFCGREFSLLDEQMILSHREVPDSGTVLYDILPCMKNLAYLDMDSCGVDNESMAALRDAFQGIHVVWRVWFGIDSCYTCRTDVTRILASSEAYTINNWNSEGLYYCTYVRYLDIGHSGLYDLSFLYNMPDLEVLIIACAPWTDASPVASCEKLEYLEILSTECQDVTPFAELRNLRHLNIANCWQIYDITPLYGMTWLERLWIGAVDPVPMEQKEEIIRLLPDTEINIEVYNHKEGGWCKDVEGNNVPRYALLREQFGGYSRSAYSYSWNDPLYTKSIDELTDEELQTVEAFYRIFDTGNQAQ